MNGFPTLRLALNTVIGNKGITLSPTKSVTPLAVSRHLIGDTMLFGDEPKPLNASTGTMLYKLARAPDVYMREKAHQIAFDYSKKEARDKRTSLLATFAPNFFKIEYTLANNDSLDAGIFTSYITDRDYFVAAMLHAITNDLPQLSATIESARQGTIDGCWGAPSSETVVTQILNRMAQEGRLPAGYSSAAQVWERIHELALIAGEE